MCIYIYIYIFLSLLLLYVLPTNHETIARKFKNSCIIYDTLGLSHVCTDLKNIDIFISSIWFW